MSSCELELMSFVAELGRGSFATVKCSKAADGTLIAVKMYRRIEARGRSERIFAEKDVQGRLSNPYIVKLLSTAKDDEYLYFKLEAVLGGPLHKHLAQSSTGVFTIHQTVGITAEVVSALLHMHALGCIHRDLKLSNLLVDGHGHIKLSDFGSSKCIFDIADCQGSFSPRKSYLNCYKTNTFIGTTPFIAPEILLRIPHCLPVDWYSLGVVIFEMLTGTITLCSELCREESLSSQSCWNGKLQAILGVLTNLDAADLLSKLLSFDPETRFGFWSSEAILQHTFFDGIDWERLNCGTASPPLAEFDQRLGNLDLLSDDRRNEKLVSDSDNRLFIGF